MAVQAITLVVVAVVDLASAGSDAQPSRAVASAVAIVLLAGCVGVLAYLLLRRPVRARTATVVWNLVMVPVGVDLFQAGQQLLGIALLLVAAAAIVAAILAERAARTG